MSCGVLISLPKCSKLPEKAALVRRLVVEQLVPGGRLVIADVSFLTWEGLQAVHQSAGDARDEEPYWIAADALPELEKIGAMVTYEQVSDSAGFYCIRK